MKKPVKMKILALGLVIALAGCGGAEERKARYMEKGKEYYAEKNYDKASIEFKNVMQIDPKFADAYYYMGRVEESNKDLGKAVGNYQQAIQLNPDYVDAKARLARIFVIVGTAEYINQAKKLIQEIFAKQPDHAEAILVDATIESKAGNRDQAVTKLQQVIAKSPDLVDAYALLAVIQLSQGNEDAAIATMQQGIANNDTEVGLRMMLARLYAKDNRDLAAAEALAKKVIEIEPDVFSHRLGLATFYSTTSRPELAEAALRQAITDSEDDAQRYLVLVEFLAGKKTVKAAEDELLAAIKKKPELFTLQFALAEFYQNLKMQDKAIQALVSISDKQDMEADGLKAKTKLADMYLSRGDMKQAQSYLDTVLEEAPNDADALLVKGKMAFMRQDDQTVINSLRSVLKDEPKNDEAALLLAQAHERNNETELAKETLLRILEADPLNAKNHLNYANYLASKNEMKAAEETLDKALAYFKADYDLMQGKLKFAAFHQDEAGVKNLLEQMKVNFPGKEEVRMQIGRYYFSKKQFSFALTEFDAALQVSTTQYEPLKAMIETLLAMKQEAKAQELLQARLTKNADDPLANYFLGQLVAGKDRTKALSYFTKAMQQNSWDAPFIAASTLHLAAKDLASAMAVLEGGVKKIANPAGLQMQMASIYELQKQFDKAMAVYEKVLEQNPANQMAANNLASLLLDFGTTGDAAKRALELASGFAKTRHPAFMDTLGWATLKNNDAAKAVSVLEEVNRMQPDVGVFQYHLGMAYQMAGDLANAKRYLSMAVASKQNYPGKDKAMDALAKL